MIIALTSKRILNVTLIDHPVLDVAAADEALMRVAQATEKAWGGVVHASVDPLSPAARRWRGECPVQHDNDTPMDRQDLLLAVFNQLAADFRHQPPSAEAARVLGHGQWIYSGQKGDQIQWGLTLTLSGRGVVEMVEQGRLNNGPLIVPDRNVILTGLRDTLEAAQRSEPDEASPALSARRRRPLAG